MTLFFFLHVPLKFSLIQIAVFYNKREQLKIFLFMVNILSLTNHSFSCLLKDDLNQTDLH